MNSGRTRLFFLVCVCTEVDFAFVREDKQNGTFCVDGCFRPASQLRCAPSIIGQNSKQLDHDDCTARSFFFRIVPILPDSPFALGSRTSSNTSVCQIFVLNPLRKLGRESSCKRKFGRYVDVQQLSSYCWPFVPLQHLYISLTELDTTTTLATLLTDTQIRTSGHIPNQRHGSRKIRFGRV